MAAKVKYREVVRELALDRYGYVTTKDAVGAGVPAIELPKLAARGAWRTWPTACIGCLTFR